MSKPGQEKAPTPSASYREALPYCRWRAGPGSNFCLDTFSIQTTERRLGCKQEIALCRQRPNGHQTRRSTGFAVVSALDGPPPHDEAGSFSRSTVSRTRCWLRDERARAGLMKCRDYNDNVSVTASAISGVLSFQQSARFTWIPPHVSWWFAETEGQACQTIRSQSRRLHLRKRYGSSCKRFWLAVRS